MSTQAKKYTLGILILVIMGIALFVSGTEKIGNITDSSPEIRNVTIAIVYKSGDDFSPVINGFKDGVEKLLNEKTGVHIIYRMAEVNGEGQAVYDAVAKSVVATKPDLIFAIAVNAVPAVMNATKGTSIPVVYTLGGDPVALKYVESMQESKNNMTGVTWRAWELSGKRLEALSRMKPNIKTVIMLTKKSGASLPISLGATQDTAKKLGIVLNTVEISTRKELEHALFNIDEEQVDAMFYIVDPFFVDNADLLIATSISKKLPIVFHDKRQVSRGALASYGADYYAAGSQSSRLARKIIIGGLHPSQIPSEGVTKLQLVLNAHTANKMGIVFSDEMLTTADEVIPVLLDPVKKQ